MEEVDRIKDECPTYKDRLLVSKKAHIILPTHRILDAASEAAKGDAKIGSTLRGIGPTYRDKIGRSGLRSGDILEEKETIITVKSFWIDLDSRVARETFTGFPFYSFFLRTISRGSEVLLCSSARDACILTEYTTDLLCSKSSVFPGRVGFLNGSTHSFAWWVSHLFVKINDLILNGGVGMTSQNGTEGSQVMVCWIRVRITFILNVLHHGMDLVEIGVEHMGLGISMKYDGIEFA
jgi:hypothetical protein